MFLIYGFFIYHLINLVLFSLAMKSKLKEIISIHPKNMNELYFVVLDQSIDLK